MKVVLFCGGLGMRLRDFSENIPKPMVPIGNRPILWHVMKYYASYGHNDFVLCLGYKGDVIKEYFLNYQEWLSNDFVLSNGGRELHLMNRDIDDWRITFADTGMHSSIGQRLLAVRSLVQDEEMFLANYSDGLTNMHLPDMIDHFRGSGATASFLCVHSSASFHLVGFDGDGSVADLSPVADADIWVNGGYYAFRPEIFDVLHDGEELVEEPFARLIDRRALTAYRYTGFWSGMDTFKDRQRLQDLHDRGQLPVGGQEAPRPALAPVAVPNRLNGVNGVNGVNGHNGQNGHSSHRSAPECSHCGRP
jgi:glucose-1-phosphate cytidylyltransferase